ncbi:PadR family transcriptional regulator [Nonomuraea sp. H19]|uniref:PadR family transcriptional regulator n=1 Tax=Nonomuraea sp. H19 TaxID=3452206 RepID=UPI003F89CA43
MCRNLGILLTALADAPRHGYALIKEVEDISCGRVRLRTGTLYAALSRLQQQGWVHIVGEEVVEGRHRRYYALTDVGTDALAEETVRLRATLQEASRRLRLRLRPSTEASAPQGPPNDAPPQVVWVLQRWDRHADEISLHSDEACGLAELARHVRTGVHAV